jgi:hypothetical protein
MSSESASATPAGLSLDINPHLLKIKVRPFGNGLISTDAVMLSIMLQLVNNHRLSFTVELEHSIDALHGPDDHMATHDTQLTVVFLDACPLPGKPLRESCYWSSRQSH